MTPLNSKFQKFDNVRPLPGVTQQVASHKIPAAFRELCNTTDIQEVSPTEWVVTSGRALQALVEGVGPDSITRCNLLVAKPCSVKREWKDNVKVVTHSASRRSSATTNTIHRLSDHMTLTDAGRIELARRDRRKLADPTVVRGTLYCSGDVNAGSRRLLVVQQSGRPNCRRKCGGIGQCVSGCTGTGLGHACQFHITVSASLSQVADGKVTVKLAGSHVPPGSLWVPPHPLALSPSKLVMDQQVTAAGRQVRSDRHRYGEQERWWVIERSTRAVYTPSMR